MTTNNHPAHGPVSLDRLHQIREILSKAAAQSDGGNLGYAMSDAVKVIAGAIAAIGAEPVAYMYKDKLHADARFSLDTRFGNWSQEDINEYEITEIPLYTAPPVPVVPDEITPIQASRAYGGEVRGYRDGWNACRAAMLQSFGNSEQLIKQPSNKQDSDSNDSWDEIKQPSSNCIPGVQEFIDAMIQDEDVSLTNEGEMLRFLRNSPASPDCWISVSERMPEESGRYWCYVEEQNSLGKSHYQWNCSWNGEAWSDKALSGRVTHWMPLPASPQQEVKS